MKTKWEKKLNNKVKNLNRKLEKDVFGNRFWLKQVRKSKGTDGIFYFMYELRDRVQPERNKLINGWFTEYSIFNFSELVGAMNDFIITSDFWENYKKNKAD